MGLIISYGVGFACILFPKKAIKVIQAIINKLAVNQSNYMNTELPDEKDTTIGPAFSVVIGLLIVGLTAFAHS